MNDALRMQISAFVDGELPENESELLLRRLSQDAALRRQVGEYIQIGRLIRGERDVRGMGALRRRIAAALGEQPVEAPAKPEQVNRRYLKPAAGVAIAASVAVVALMGLRQVNAPDVSGFVADRAVVPTTAGESIAAGYTQPAAENAVVPRPGDLRDDLPRDMLTQYYLSHGATSGDLGANGILTRLVTLELREGELVEVPANTSGPEVEVPAGRDPDGGPEGNEQR